jgi:hypothetical protein
MSRGAMRSHCRHYLLEDDSKGDCIFEADNQLIGSLFDFCMSLDKREQFLVSDLENLCV